MTIFIFDTINSIPSHKQFQDLAVSLVKDKHDVYQFSDSDRPSYDGVSVITYHSLSRLKLVGLFFIYFIKYKPDVVISTFRSNLLADILSYFFVFKWIAFYQSDFYNDKIMNRLRYRKSKSLVVVSSPMVEKLGFMYNHLRGRIFAVNNSFVFQKTFIKRIKKNIILHVGNADKNNSSKFIKGSDLVIYAFNELINSHDCDVELWMVGSGPNLEELKQMAQSNERIKFLGRVDNKDVHDLMSFAKILVLPSRNDAFPNVYLEAMNYGCSLIGTKNTGAEDIILSGRYGRIVEQEDINALSNAFLELIKKYNYEQVWDQYLHKREQFSRELWVHNMTNLINGL